MRKDIAYIAIIALLALGMGLYIGLRRPKVVTNTVTIERVRIIEKRIRANEMKSSNIRILDGSLEERQRQLELEIARALGAAP